MGIADTEKAMTEIETEISQSLGEAKTQDDIAAAKAEELAEIQIKLSSAIKEHDDAERVVHPEILAGEELRQAKETHVTVLEGPFQNLNDGVIKTEEEKENAAWE